MDTVIVDGYNVIHAWPELKAELARGPLEAPRTRLIALLREYAAVRHVRVTVVFDGPRTVTAQDAEVVDGVEVRFSGRAGSADHVIERLAYEATRAGDAVTVATSDRLQRDIVRAMGGVTIDAAWFEREVRAALAETSSGAVRLRELAQMSRRVADRLPGDVAAQLEAIRLGRPVPPASAPENGRERAARRGRGRGGPRGSLRRDGPA